MVLLCHNGGFICMCHVFVTISPTDDGEENKKKNELEMHT